MVKLVAFRIRNFRSIVDSEWQNISPDNITCLIGQNVCGKTSVLEGLRAFYTGSISEDVLRSDLSMPEISCRFSIEKGWLLNVIDDPGTELKELMAGLDLLELTRSWLADFSSVVRVSGVVSDYLDSLENAWRLYLEEVSLKLLKESTYIGETENKLRELSAEKSAINQVVEQDKRQVKSFRFLRRKASSTGIEKSGDKNSGRQLADVIRQEEELRKELLSKRSIKKAGESYITLTKDLGQLDGDLAEISLKLEERHQRMTLLMTPMEDFDETEWKKVLDNFRKTKSERDTLAAELDNHLVFSAYIMEGFSEADAMQKIGETTQNYKSQYTSEILGSKYFEYCPVIELFEDFGSLLPNRIDMEDIITGNEEVEGYKAARNFLTIARLDYSFFQQPSTRILKQKIENLNHTLTLNFQDFWQQSIGRNNKIRIQFELEHYNSSFGDKAGKPYLEFWIKDEGERLYPKQRSRGVRWFLSFYLELKAAASRNKKSMVLLVDEPGVSLHARAQEDVLKVFEDIKERIQVVYTTHSPHLVDINKLHRVLAVQRDDIESLKSNTRILDPLRLSSATPDTLTPLQSIMGNPFAGQGFSPGSLNLIVNDIGTFYMLSAILLVSEYKGEVSLIPSTDVSSIPLMCNILLGWGLRFAVMLFANDEEKQMEEFLKQNMFRIEITGGDRVFRMKDKFLNAEDLLSTLDFKNHVIESREGITVQNSVYMIDKELPRNFLLSKFLAAVKSGAIGARDLDEETHDNISYFTTVLTNIK